MTWSYLPLSAKAVLPVIYAYDNSKGKSWPSEETIAVLSGLSCKTVRKGINELFVLPGFSFDFKMTAQGRKSKRFTLSLPSDRDKVFFFHKFLLTGGNWRLLKAISKAVYPVLRVFSAWDKEEAEEGEDGMEDDYKDLYASRQWEYSEVESGIIAKYAGIARQNVQIAIHDLEDKCLVERVDRRWKVYLSPPKYFKRDFLNEQVIKSFGYRNTENDQVS